MEWMSDPSAGAWVRERLDTDLETMHSVVPRGFAAYARILHPAIVRSLPDRAVPTSDEWDRLPESEQHALRGQFVDEPATWARTAAAFDTTLHPLAQWHRIVRTPTDEDWRTRIAPDGREFSAPLEGELAPEHLAAIATHLVGHTQTPDAGFAALWEGRGDLFGFYGITPSGGSLAFTDDPNHQAMLDRSTHDPFNNVFRKPTWQEGILSREISEGPRLRLPMRDHVLFSAPPRAFADPEWARQVPWRDRLAEERGFPRPPQSPSLLWPEDHAWVMVSEVDFDSTIVAGSPALIAALSADERLEAFAIPEGADLTWDADTVNR
ncbi:hypothetical protein J7E45_10525 [Microbacterium sp. ISL-59]|uniref:hypothetical protein n=1 Tax=Microbacterium sp. ISL-59 TaxID=2819159 RepID=UPI001BE6ED12|nr:hypothetical protein [Microbacterium sp. ISL-59]MBT2496043.1 hypothetical protein [Microbacterium sp. ISL-59]